MPAACDGQQAIIAELLHARVPHSNLLDDWPDGGLSGLMLRLVLQAYLAPYPTVWLHAVRAASRYVGTC